MRHPLLITATILLFATLAGAVRNLESPHQLPASTPNLQSIRGVTSSQPVLWRPIVAGKIDFIWTAHLAERSGYLSIASGKPISFTDELHKYEILSQKAAEFVDANAEMLGCVDCDPLVSDVKRIKNLTILTIELSIEDIRIEGASIILVINQFGALISVKADTYGSNTFHQFQLNEESTQSIALKSVASSCKIELSRSIWLPQLDDQQKIRLKAARRVELKSQNPSFQPRIYVDATNGTILAAENRVNFVDVEGAASGGIFPHYGREQPELRSFVDEQIRIEDRETFTDQEGLFRLDLNDNDAPFNSDIYLRGHWVEVQEFDSSNANFIDSFELDQFAEVLWSNDNSSPDERNLFYHVNIIHDRYKQIEPDFDGMDFPITAVCGVGGAGYEQLEDNAFSTGPEIYFGRGNQADNFAHYSDVIYHEYSHSVTGQVYGNHSLPYEGESGAMNEGWSDYFTCSLTDEPLIGEGGLLGNGFIRNLDNRLMYPNDIDGEVHDDSRIFSAALWHTREILGAQYCDSLFHFARYLYANDFSEYFLDVLITDDDDGDITNGSPHYRTIYEQFARHGISFADSSHFNIARLTLHDLGSEGGQGADNGFYEPNETIAIDLDVFRAGAPIPLNGDSVFVQLDTDSPYLEILRGRVTLPALAPGEIGSTPEPLLVRIDAEAPLTFANIYIIAGASEGETPHIDTLRIPLGHPQMLVVRDGDIELDRSPWIHRALDRLNLVYSDLNSVNPAYPLARMLPAFESIIWFTGDERQNVLNEDSRELLSEYLDHGGNLLLTGQYISSWTGAEDFLSRRMGAQFVSDTLALTYLEGEDGDSIGNGQRLLLIGGEGARNQGHPAIIAPVNGGIVTHRWARVDGRPAGAVRRFDRRNHSKTIFFAFGIEAIGAAGRTTPLHDVLEKSLVWMASEEYIEDRPEIADGLHLFPVYPNPFNGTTTISYSLPSALPIKVEIYDLSGRFIESLVESRDTKGLHRIAWRSDGKPSGLYFVQLQTPHRVERRSLLLLR